MASKSIKKPTVKKTVVQKVVKAVKDVVNPPFVFTVKIENETYEGQGETALEALKAIPVPTVISTGTLTITHGDKSKEMLYPTAQLKRIFNIYHQDVLISDLIAGL